MVTALAFLSWRSKASVAHETDVPVSAAPSADESSETSADDYLRLILDSIPLPVWLRDPELALAYTNEAARNTGAMATDRGTHIAARARADGRAHTERRMLDADGARRIMEITEAPLLGINGGDGAGTIGFAVEHDAPRADELENTLMRERAIFDQMLEALGSGVAIFDADKRLESFNSAYAALWRLSEDWLTGRPTLTQILEKLRDERRLTEVADFRAYRAEENALFDRLHESLERTLHLPDGRAIRNTVAPASHGGLMHVYDDMTDTLSLQRSYKTLDAVQRHTIDNLQESVAVFGGDGRLRLHNTAFAKLWDLSLSDNESGNGPGPHLSEIVDRMRDPDEAADEWAIRRSGILSSLTQRREHKARFRRGDGQVLDVASVPLPDGAVLVSYLDVTEEAKVEAALRARAEMLEETDRLKSKFIADISYEIRTPMTTITGYSQILDAGYFGDLTPRQQEYVQGIQTSAESLMTVAADILELAAIESGTAVLDKDAVDLHALLAPAMGLITERARHKDLYLTFDVPTDIGWLSADGRRLKQVVFNLLSNAVRFTPARGGVRLSASRNDNGVIIEVADTGTGIPQADIDRVFQKFAKGDQPEGEPDGAGLGLAMVKSFVELHGGTVTIKSSPNRGTTVTCALPATGTEGGDARDAFQT